MPARSCWRSTCCTTCGTGGASRPTSAAARAEPGEPLRIEGAVNLLFLAGVVAARRRLGRLARPGGRASWAFTSRAATSLRDAIPPRHAGGVVVRDARSGRARRTSSPSAPSRRSRSCSRASSSRSSRRMAMLRVGEAGRDGVRRPRRARAGAVLLGQRHPVVLPRQRAHLPGLPVDRARAGCFPASPNPRPFAG